MIKLETVRIEKPENWNIILGQSHFIKTVEDLYEALKEAFPEIKFGIAFCESSGKCLVRWAGNDEECIEIAKKNAMKVSAGHFFIIVLKNAYPINVIDKIKKVSEVVTLYCATANPVEVIVAETEQGRGVLGVIDGYKTKGIETEEDIEERKKFLRNIGYKL